MKTIDGLVARLRAADWKERDAIKAEMLVLATGPEGAPVREHLDTLRRGELLEIQWEIEEVLEKTSPPKPVAAVAPPPPAPEPEPPAAPEPGRQLTSKDLTLVYDDPRGLLLHKAKVGDRWFATQVDPRTGQPQTFELHPQEITQLKAQLAGSPHWILGSGGLAPTPAPARPPAR